MAETEHYGLYVTDDDTTPFKSWREQVNGTADSNMTKIDAALAGKAEKSEDVEAVLLADGWTGAAAPFTQNITVENMTAVNNGSASLARSATEEQRTAAEDAELRVSDQAEGVLTIVADGVKPTVDIPVLIVLMD